MIDVDAVALGEEKIDVAALLFASATWPENPPLPVIVTVKVVEPVLGTVAELGETLIEKSPVAETECTTRLAATECTTEPLVPVIVNG